MYNAGDGMLATRASHCGSLDAFNVKQVLYIAQSHELCKNLTYCFGVAVEMNWRDGLRVEALHIHPK